MIFPDEYTTIAILNGLASDCFKAVSKKGFHEDHEELSRILKVSESDEIKEWFESTTFQAEIARMHSELSEALEGVRKPKPDDHLPQFDSVVVELADCLIRIFDSCGKRGLPIGEAVVEKFKYNASRPRKHGKNS